MNKQDLSVSLRKKALANKSDKYYMIYRETADSNDRIETYLHRSNI